MKVFLLQHTHASADGSQDVKAIGVYSSEENARRAIERLSCLPGFSSKNGAFHLDAYELDQGHWTEGFATVDLTQVP